MEHRTYAYGEFAVIFPHRESRHTHEVRTLMTWQTMMNRAVIYKCNMINGMIGLLAIHCRIIQSIHHIHMSNRLWIWPKRNSSLPNCTGKGNHGENMEGSCNDDDEARIEFQYMTVARYRPHPLSRLHSPLRLFKLPF